MPRDGSLLDASRNGASATQHHEVAALLDAARDLASTLDLRPLLELLLDHLHALVGYGGTAILVLEDQELVFAGMRGPDSFTWDEARPIRYPVADFGPVWPRLCAGEPVIIPDVYAEGTEARIFRSLVGEQNLRTSLAFIRTCMWVPLVVRDHLIGVLLPGTPDGSTATLVDGWAAGRGLRAERIHAAGVYAYDATLRDMAHDESNSVVREAATGLEYPTRDLQLAGPSGGLTSWRGRWR